MRGNIAISKTFSMCDWSQMDSFIAKTHGASHVLRQRPVFDWFFLRNTNSETANVLVAYEGSKLISLLGYLPTNFLWGGEIVLGAWMAHWMTLPEYRSGIGALLMRKITEMFPIVAGQGASMMNQEIVQKMKFNFLEKMPKLVYVLNPDKVRTAFSIELIGKGCGGGEHCEGATQVTSLNSINYNPDWAHYHSLKYGTLRDSDYLAHRYIDYPFFKYYVFLEGPRTMPVVCVARIIDTAIGIRVARILEFFYPENSEGKSNATHLIKKCLNFFNKNNCDYADFYCTSAVYGNLLSEAGFVYENDGVLPSLLDPIDMSRKAQNVELFLSATLRAKYPGSEKYFFVTRADGDQDRPNESYSGPVNGKSARSFY